MTRESFWNDKNSVFGQALIMRVCLRENSGIHFDPDVVDVFFKNLIEIGKIQNKYRE